MRPRLRGGEQPVARTRRSSTSACCGCRRSTASDIEKAEHNYDPETVPEKGYFYMPVQCQQCRNPPCVKVCPVQATWQETDGIMVIDYDWCIGCRYCVAACPYWARRFNFTEPDRSRRKHQPGHGLPGQPAAPQGRDGEMHTSASSAPARAAIPACLEVCPTGARKFGNLLDPDSEVSYILNHKRVFILKEEVGTLPRFFYFFDVAAGADHGNSRFFLGAVRHRLRGRQALLRLDGRADGADRLLGLNAYAKQFAQGLHRHRHERPGVLGRSTSRNFTFLVGVAAAAVMLVIPVYIYNRKPCTRWCCSASCWPSRVIMCLLFVTVDLGRPDRFWHLIPAPAASTGRARCSPGT